MKHDKRTWFNQAKFVWDFLMRHRKELCVGILNQHDQDRALIAMQLMFDVLYGVISSTEVTNWIPRWLTAVSQCGFLTLIQIFDKADTFMLYQIESTGLIPSYDSFKHYLRVISPYAGAVLAPLRGVWDYHCDESVKLGGKLHTVFCFLKHYSYNSDALEREAVSSYLECEERETPEFDSGPATFLERWFPKTLKPQFYDPRCKHGSGSTADAGGDLYDKYSALGTDSWIHYLCTQYQSDEFWTNGFERTSKLTFVPKSYKSYRTISMEPATLQWYQQGFNDSLVKLIGRNAFLRDRIQFDHQEHNQMEAYIGSRFADYSATIDLHAASDSVLKAHIDSWYKRTSLYPFLIGTRSTKTLMPNGEKIHLKKFAPMGSALNFSIESLTFCAIGCYAIVLSGDRPSSSILSVYGDDIVIEPYFYDTLVELLTRYGFTVNEEKSYRGAGSLVFRESCGGHFLNGWNITPVHISRFYDCHLGNMRDKHLHRWIPNYVALYNNSLVYNWLQPLRWQLLEYIETLPRCFRPMFGEDESSLLSPSPTNYSLNSGWDEGLQTEWFQHGVLLPDKPRKLKVGEERFALYEWLRSVEGRKEIGDEPTLIQYPARNKSPRWGWAITPGVFP